MKLRDELETEIQQCKDDSETTIQEIAFRTTLSAIPFAGAALLELSNGLAQRRTQERLNSVFEHMKNRLNLLGEEQVDRAYFHTEAFQSLLHLLLERLHTTHDAKKLKMFGDALANSGSVDFKADDKEDYIRVLRDLSLSDLTVLNDHRLKNWLPHLPHVHINYSPEVQVSLYRLQSMGLVLAKLSQKGIFRTGSPAIDIESVRSSLSTQPPETTFYLSPFGKGFLCFILPEDQTQKPPI